MVSTRAGSLKWVGQAILRERATFSKIVITGYPDSEILDRILQVSPVTVLKKPLKVEQLNQTLKILVHNGPSWRAEQQNLKPLAGL